MVNYSNSKIYKICSFQTDLIYIGSTTQPLSKRLAKHKDDYNHNKGTTSKEILKYSDAQIILLESVNCENKDQLHAIERRYIENNNCCNKNIPTRTKKEYQQSDKGKESKKESQKKYQQSEKGKEYKQSHKEQQKEYQKEYQKKYQQSEKNKESKKEYYKKYKQSGKGVERQKKYQQSEKCKESHKKSQKKYNEKNKEQNKEYQKQYQKEYYKFRNSEIGIFLRSFNFKCSCEV